MKIRMYVNTLTPQTNWPVVSLPLSVIALQAFKLAIEIRTIIYLMCQQIDKLWWTKSKFSYGLMIFVTVEQNSISCEIVSKSSWSGDKSLVVMFILSHIFIFITIPGRILKTQQILILTRLHLKQDPCLWSARPLQLAIQVKLIIVNKQNGETGGMSTVDETRN